MSTWRSSSTIGALESTCRCCSTSIINHRFTSPTTNKSTAIRARTYPRTKPTKHCFSSTSSSTIISPSSTGSHSGCIVTNTMVHSPSQPSKSHSPEYACWTCVEIPNSHLLMHSCLMCSYSGASLETILHGIALLPCVALASPCGISALCSFQPTQPYWSPNSSSKNRCLSTKYASSTSRK